MIEQTFLKSLEKWHTTNKKIVLVTGVFDIFHSAHKAFLQRAKQEGDVLIVGLESDIRVQKIKGEGRPINNQGARQQKLEKEQLADHVFILPEQFNSREDYLELLQLIKPKVLAVSSHTKHLDSKQELMNLVGGTVTVVMNHDPSISTTQLLNKQIA